MGIIYLVVAWFAGIWLASLWGLPPMGWLGLAAATLAGAFLLRREPRARLALLCLAVLSLGALRYITAQPHFDEGHVAGYNDQGFVILTGVVVQEPDIRDRMVNLRLRAEQAALADGSVRSVDGLVLVQTPRFPVIPYGARVEIAGSLVSPPQNPEFSYRDYLARQGVHSLVGWPRLTVLAYDQGSPVMRTILAVKARAGQTIQRIMPDPQAALLSAVLLGQRENLSPNLIDAFRQSGLSHLIVVSGFHVSILVAALLTAATPLLGPRRAFWLALLGLAFYTLMVGAGPSVVRAAIMGGVYLLAKRVIGRPTFSAAGLFTAGFLMTLVHPMILWEIGFQLSFAATLSIMLYADRLSRWGWGQIARRSSSVTADRVMGWAGEVIAVSTAAQILVLPLIAVYFGRISLVSLLANALVLPLQPAILTIGGLAAFVGIIFLPAGQLLGWIVWLLLTITIVIVEALAALPLATVPIFLSTEGVLLIYASILGLTWLGWRPAEERREWRAWLRQHAPQRAIIAGMGMAALLLIAWGWSQPDGRLHITFFDVGQGDAILIRTPTGRHILVDGGQYPTRLHDRLGREIPFWRREIDLLVATHPGDSYMPALPGLFDRYRIGRLMVDGPAAGSPLFEELKTAAGRHETPLHYALAGEKIVIEDDVWLETLHPDGRFSARDRRDYSIVLRLVYGDFSLLLTGGAGAEAEEFMLAEGRVMPATILKAAQHGSDRATGEEWLTAVQPQIVIISVGEENRFGQPHPELLERIAQSGALLLRTDQAGTIQITTDGQQLWWQTER